MATARLRPADAAELCALAALWGGSFLFIRLGAAEFGPAALVFLRVAGASLLLVPLALGHGHAGAMRRHWRDIAIVGLLNSALPFALYNVAALVLNAGLSSIFNAATPLWGAVIAWLWMGDRPTPARALGLAIGFAGVAGLGWQTASLRGTAHGVSPALGMLACLGATLLYGFAANFTKRRLTGVPPLAVAAGSQLAALVLATPQAALLWPAVAPAPSSWLAAAALAFACTGLAYLLFFRLIAHAGPANAMSVTFLIPAFGVLWGWLFLGETLTAPMLAGCAVILVGTALATGVLRFTAAPSAHRRRP